MELIDTDLEFGVSIQNDNSLDKKSIVVSGKRFDRFRGFTLALLGAVLWGVSGTAAQVLFQHDGFSPAWLVSARMSVSGLLLITGLSVRFGPGQVFAIWRNKKDVVRVILFGAGLLGVQYTYFVTIRYSNAAMGTLLQYMGPIFITVFLAFRGRRLPTRFELVAVLLAVFGVALLVTNGNWHGLSVSPLAVTWGLISALTVAFYTLYPAKLLQKYGAAIITGWAMIIGGIGMNTMAPLWGFAGVSTFGTWWLVFFVVIFGTLIPFYVYIASLKYISASEVSLLASGEPLSAAIIAIAILHVQLSMAALFGALCILVTVTLLAFKGSKGC